MCSIEMHSNTREVTTQSDTKQVFERQIHPNLFQLKRLNAENDTNLDYFAYEGEHVWGKQGTGRQAIGGGGEESERRKIPISFPKQ